MSNRMNEPSSPEHPERRPLAITPEGAVDLWSAPATTAVPARRRLSPGVLWRFKWLALSVALLAGAPAITAVWLLNQPLYEARAAIEVSPMIPRILYSTDDNGLIPLYNQYLNNQATVLRSPTVLQRALDSRAVQSTGYYRDDPRPLVGSPPSKLERLRDDLDVRIRANTSFVDVRLATRTPEESAVIVNAIIDEYLKYVYERSQKFDDDVYQALSQEYNALQQKIEGLKNMVAQLRGGLMTSSPEELQAQQRARLDYKVAELEDLRQRIALAEWRHKQLVELAEHLRDRPTSQPAAENLPYATDPEWRRLFLDVRTAEHQQDLAAERFGANSDQMFEHRKNVQYARDLLRLREAQLDELFHGLPNEVTAGAGARTLEDELRGLTLHIGQMRYEEELRAADVEQEQLRVEKTAAAAQMLRKELDDLAYAEQRFRDIRQRKVAMEIERRAPGSIRIQDQAFAPSQPANSKRRLLTALLAAGGALAFGMLTAYLRASTNPAVQQVADLPLAAPCLGNLPLARRARQVGAVQAESIRMVRTALLQRIAEGRSCAIQITSAGPGAGKTTVAVLLAESLARCGKRVLLVDADLRRPALHAKYELPQAPGLAELLAGTCADEAAIIPSSGAGVDVLAAGQASEVHGELLANGVLTERLAHWRAQYDVVIFDGAPLLPVADARILSRRMDGNVLVVREGHCRRAAVVQALGRLHGAGGPLLGMVFFSRSTDGVSYPASYGYASAGVTDDALDAREAWRP